MAERTETIDWLADWQTDCPGATTAPGQPDLAQTDKGFSFDSIRIEDGA